MSSVSPLETKPPKAPHWPNGLSPEEAPREGVETAPCPACGSSRLRLVARGRDLQYHVPGVFFVSECRDCGLPRRRMHCREILVGESMAAEAPRRSAESLLLA